MRLRPRIAVVCGVALLATGLGWTTHRALAPSSAAPLRAQVPAAAQVPVHTTAAPAAAAAARTGRAPRSVSTAPRVVAPPTVKPVMRRAAVPPAAVTNAAPKAAPVRPVAREHTGWAALDAAIARIPHYYPGIAHWHVEDKGAWGATMLDTGDIFIAPRTPLADLYSVAVHEYAHAITGHLYGGFAPAQVVADRLFGQQGEYGLEVEADCMARVEGATWTNYTSCANSTWRAYARVLVTMHRP